jgi:hypothetical protein
MLARPAHATLARATALAFLATLASTMTPSTSLLTGPQGQLGRDPAPARRSGTQRPPIAKLGTTSAAQFADAVGLAAADVLSIQFNGSSNAAIDVFDAAVGGFPIVGGSYFVMSTGDTASALLPNTDPDTSTELGGLDNSQGNDLVQAVIVLRPPAGATCVAFDFRFLSEEFPEYVGSKYNDAFLAEIGQSTFQIVNNQIIAPNNFAFDALGNVVSINTTFGANAGNAAGTTYDGATPLLTAVSPLERPGADITITLSITDLGDSIYDSTVFLDNLRWFFGLSCLPGADADTDGDDLLDDWETNGIDFDNDGVVDLDLPAMGADPLHKDMFIEIDYMVLSGTGGHTHKPKADALQIAIDTFANAPVANPDGDDGIRLHIDAGSDTIMNPVTNATWGTRTRSDALTHQNNLGTGTNPYDWTEFDGIKGLGAAGSFSIERANVFHYCIFAHNLSSGLGSTSGISRGIPASDFLVTLGGWTGSVGTTNEQAGTLIHEFGHNLSLRHGGNDHANYKPNYLSVMSYFFQTRGLRVGGADGTFDFSRTLLPSLDENALDETVGITSPGTAGYGTRYYSGGVARIADAINGPIDWNADGDGGADASVAIDINNSGARSVLGTSNNWAEIRFDGGAVGHLGEMITLPTFTEPMDIDEPTDELIPTEFAVCIGGPGSVSLAACDPTTYTFAVLNKGFGDDVYSVQATSSAGWADLSGIPTSLALAAGGSTVFSVPVLVPQGTPNGAQDLVVIRLTSTSNPLISDVAETTTVASSIDGDGDGLTDECDDCPDSDLGATIVIDDCDTGVANHWFSEGCSMSDLIAECRASAANHGAFVSCVAHLASSWRNAGLITGQQRGAIVSCAARAH